MADQKPTTNYYNLLGGVNTKASEYAAGQAGFRDLRNLDFFVPNALQKRQGSTQAVTTGTSGPISSMFEFERLDGASFVVAGSDTAMFYLAANSYTLLSSGWSNGQPTDMLTFVNKLWMANGQKFESWGGSAAVSPVQAGLPGQRSVLVPKDGNNGASFFFVGGATCFINPAIPGSASFLVRGVYVAYSYLRNDGYVGPANFIQTARNVMGNARPTTSGDEYFNTYTTANGVTIPAGYGISAIQLWVATDVVSGNSPTMFIDSTLPGVKVGNLGWEDKSGGTSARRMSYSLHPSADTTRFHLYTTFPGASFSISTGLSGYNPPVNFGSSETMWVVPFSLGSSGFDQFAAVAAGDGFSGMVFDLFATYTPKYIEQNNNVMFMAGFSAQPSVVWFSQIGEPEYVLPENNFEIRTNDGDRMTGLKAYNNTVVATKERSFSKIVGAVPEDLEVVDLSTEYGNLSNKSMVEYNQKLGWLDSRGWLEYNGSTWEIISTPVEPIFRRMNVSAARDKACAVNHIFRNQIWIGIPIDGSTTNNVTVVYDYLIGAWTFFDGFSPSSFAFMKGPLGQRTAWRGDYSGKIHYFGESFYGDNGVGITCLGIPNWEIDQGQNSTSIWRRFFLDVAPAVGLTGVISGRIFSNYDDATTNATFTMYQNQFQSRAEMGVPAKAVTVEFAHFSASLPLLINGFSWTKRFLRNV